MPQRALVRQRERVRERAGDSLSAGAAKSAGTAKSPNDAGHAGTPPPSPSPLLVRELSPASCRAVNTHLSQTQVARAMGQARRARAEVVNL